jgi:hypothetical protein
MCLFQVWNPEGLYDGCIHIRNVSDSLITIYIYSVTLTQCCGAGGFSAREQILKTD